MTNMDQKNFGGRERRQHPRIAKNFILTYFKHDDPSHKYEITQIKNVSLGGVCFIASQPFPRGTQLYLEMQTPYLSDKANLRGHVLESRESVKGVLYEVRLEFENVDPEVEYILKQIVEFFIKYQGQDGYEES